MPDASHLHRGADFGLVSLHFSFELWQIYHYWNFSVVNAWMGAQCIAVWCWTAQEAALSGGFLFCSSNTQRPWATPVSIPSFTIGPVR